MCIAAAYKRWRHTRGYGVHSPFAYSLVKRVVRPPHGYAYYGYEDISMADGTESSRERREAQTLLRLANFLNVSSVYLPHSAHAIFHTALRAARSDMHIICRKPEPENCELLCAWKDTVSIESLHQYLQTPDRAVALRDAPAGWAGQLFDRLREGVMFYGRRNVIIISRPYMHKVSYSIMI